MPTAPEYTIDAAKEFQPRLRRLSLEPSDIGPEAFELLVHAWLNGIARSGEGISQDVASPWLAELTGSLQQARIEMNPIQCCRAAFAGLAGRSGQGGES